MPKDNVIEIKGDPVSVHAMLIDLFTQLYTMYPQKEVDWAIADAQKKVRK